jgi:hypothetical protein
MPATYDPIATYTVPTAISDYTFTSITSSYTDLVLVMRGKLTSAGTGLLMRFNSISSSVYTFNYMAGNGSSALGGFVGPTSYAAIGWVGTFSTDESIWTAHINSYSSGTDRFKSYIARTGNPSGQTELLQGSWARDPKATINEIQIFPGSGNIAAGTNITLYGILAA